MAYEYMGRTIEAWRAAGQNKLDAQRMRVVRYSDYYDGSPVGLALQGASRDIFRQLLRQARANWCELIVNAVAERLAVVGFRFGNEPTEQLAWYIWQANQMDADSEMVQTDALVNGVTYVSVWPDDTNPSGVRIFPEHPSQVVTFYGSTDRRVAVAAYKCAVDDWDQKVEVLVFPDVVLTWIGTSNEPVEEPNELGVVPYEKITPDPRTLLPGRSELHSAIPFQDRINTGVYNRLVAEDFGAFRQVWATGLQLSRNEDGSYNAPFNVGADRLLTSENPDSRFGSITEATLQGYLHAEAQDVQHLAAITQTPPHYLLGQMVNIPASGMKAAETGLVAKVARRASHIGEAWERVTRRALGFVGSLGAVDVTAEVIWRDFESRTEGEMVSALVQMRNLGVPLEVLWRRWGASPQDVIRWRELAAQVPTDEPVVAPSQPSAQDEGANA